MWRGGARIVSECGARFGFFEVRVLEKQICFEYSERSVVNGTPTWRARQTFLELLYRFGICCYNGPSWSRDDHARTMAEVTHGPTYNLCRVSKDFVVEVLRPGYIFSVVIETDSFS